MKRCCGQLKRGEQLWKPEEIFLHYTKYLQSKIQDRFRSPHLDTVCPTFNTLQNVYVSFYLHLRFINTLIQITCVIFTYLVLLVQQDLSPDSLYLVP